MKQNEFFNEAKEGTIRQAVADMMTSNKHLSKLEGEAYYEVEDAICELIEHNRFKIKKEVQREEVRDLLVSEVIEMYPDDFDDEDDVPEDILEEMIDSFLDIFYDEDNFDDHLAVIASEVVYSYEEELNVLDEED